MKFIQGHNRTQINLFPVSLDQSIDPDNEVQMIDLSCLPGGRLLIVFLLKIMDSEQTFLKMVVRRIILRIYLNYSFTGT